MQSLIKILIILGLAAVLLWFLRLVHPTFAVMPLSDRLIYLGLIPWMAAAVAIARSPRLAPFDVYLKKKKAENSAEPSAASRHWVTLLVISGCLPLIAAGVLLIRS